MSQNILLVVGTKPQVFTAGTVEEQFTFSVVDSVGAAFGSPVVTSATSASFSALPAGDYVASVAKNGVVVSKPFTVASTDITLQVPDTLVVNLQ